MKQQSLLWKFSTPNILGTNGILRPWWQTLYSNSLSTSVVTTSGLARALAKMTTGLSTEIVKD